MKFAGKVGNGPVNKMIKFWWRSGSPSGYRDCFPDSSLYWQIRKVVSTDCAARCCSAGHALAAAVAIETVTSLRHRPTTNGHDIRALAEVCTVPVPLVITFCVSLRRGKMYCGHPRLCVCDSVCLSVCPRPYAHTTARTRM